MTREELKVHCKKEIEMCELWANCKGEKPSGKIYEEHKLVLELLEQEPCEDCISRYAVLEYIEGSDAELGHVSENELVCHDIKELPSVTPTHKEWIHASEGTTNKDVFKTVFGYEPATDSVICNKEDWCGASKPCNYCISNPNNIGREEEWWNAPYKAESEE
jgi:hypothetical protein